MNAIDEEILNKIIAMAKGSDKEKMVRVSLVGLAVMAQEILKNRRVWQRIMFVLTDSEEEIDI